MLLILSLILTTACGGCAQRYDGIRVRPDVLLALADIHDEFKNETAWCLTGRVVNRIVEVNGMAPAMVSERTPTSATFNCIKWSPIGYVHNHPHSPARFCQPSETDRNSFARLGYPLMMVSCNGGVFIYALKGDSTLYRITPDVYGRR